jgi:hypothetical protein
VSADELAYIQKLLPKGYSLEPSSKFPRIKASKNVKEVSPQQIEIIENDAIEDLPSKRISRSNKERYRSSEYGYSNPKYSKNISDLMKRCHKVLQMLQKHEAAGPFMLPVDPVALQIPDYFDIIKEPMDLSTVEKKLRMNHYSNPVQFANDVRRIWQNAILYNPKTSAIFHMTLSIKEYFEKVFKEIEENPLNESTNEYLQRKVNKIERKLDELKNKGAHSDYDLGEHPMNYEEKRQLCILIKSSSEVTSQRCRRNSSTGSGRSSARTVPRCSTTTK